MNFVQFGLFVLYICSLLIIGSFIYNFLNKNNNTFLNRSILLGEVLLLGAIFLIGELLLLSLLGLYKLWWLWLAVLLNYLLLANKNTGKLIREILFKKVNFSFANFAFIGLVLFLFFRNCYFLIDVDSVSTYLFTQKLWLSSGSSLVGDITNDIRIFVPHFDGVPYSLGLSVFSKELLFPQLVNISWRVIALLLVFGYASYRFNKYCGLAASMFLIFDGHFFYSGANQWVLINSALIALLFASVYNFWQARVKPDSFRFILALIFLLQLMANKYQMAFVFLFILAAGVLIQKQPFKMIKEVFRSRVNILILGSSFLIMSMWYIKNALVTGDPIFPALAGKLGIFGWSPHMTDTFIKIFGGVKPQLFIKYMNYLFTWPGINAAKYLIIVLSFMPIILAISIIKSKVDKEHILELCFWSGLSILIVMGICFFCHQDPRYYRYPLGVLSFSAVFCLYYIFKYCLGIKKEIFLTGLILILAVPGYKVIYQSGGHFRRPTLEENIKVITNEIHTDYAVEKYYPYIPAVLEKIKANPQKFEKSAWGAARGMNLPAYFLPIRPVESLWLTTIVKWESYGSKEAIINDLKAQDIKWIAFIEEGKLIFLSIDEYADSAVKYERYPKKIFFDYGFPEELSTINYY